MSDQPQWYSDPDDPRSMFMQSACDALEAVFGRPDGAEYVARFLRGEVVLVVSREGVQVVDRTLGVPGDN